MKVAERAHVCCECSPTQSKYTCAEREENLPLNPLGLRSYNGNSDQCNYSAARGTAGEETAERGVSWKREEVEE